MTAYREQGYLPEAMVNFLAFLGWSPGTEEEIFTLEELAARFEIGKVHRAGAIFDVERLDHLNGLYIRALTDEQLALRLRSFVPDALDDASLLRVVPLIKERIVRLGDATELLAFLTETDAEVTGRYAADELVPKKADAAATANALGRARAVLEALDPADFSADVIEARCRAAGEELGWKAGDFFSPLRVAITGRAVSPPLFGSMELLGRDVRWRGSTARSASCRRWPAGDERLATAP